MNNQIETLNGENPCEKSCRKLEVPTEEERVALDALREIKMRVRELKSRLKSVTVVASQEAAEESKALEKELEALRRQWREWEEKRDEAARVRMVLLGHEEA
jgi:FtsZ-binding cell division protein ZapB